MEALKKKAAYAALELVENDMIIGLGTGSTVKYFIEGLIQRCLNGLKVKVVSSSRNSLELAKAGNLEVLDINDVDCVDLTVDGADEIDGNKNMIKGGGGALFREKVLALASKKLAIIVDESKYVEKLGLSKIPVEVLPYGYMLVQRKISDLGFDSFLRKKENGIVFVTDNGNYILDIKIKDGFLKNVRKMHEELKSLCGVLETGFFFDLDLTLFVATKEKVIML